MNRLQSRRTYGIPKSQNSCVRNRYRYTKRFYGSFVRKKRNLFHIAFSGSMTIEAAVALPVCMLILLSFLLFFQTMEVQLYLQQELSETGRLIAAGYDQAESVNVSGDTDRESTEPSGLTEELLYYASSETILKGIMNRKIKEELPDEAVIRGGMAGISYAGSRYDKENGLVILQAGFRMNLPFDAASRIKLRLTQRSVHRAWTGKKAGLSEKEQLVYVTENGSVYHTGRSCTHLMLSVKETTVDCMESLRNAEGRKYTACEYCGDHPSGNTVYITDYGKCYHYNKNCSGLKRTVSAVPLSEVGDLKLCSRCRKKGTQ